MSQSFLINISIIHCAYKIIKDLFIQFDEQIIYSMSSICTRVNIRCARYSAYRLQYVIIMYPIINNTHV